MSKQDTRPLDVSVPRRSFVAALAAFAALTVPVAAPLISSSSPARAQNGSPQAVVSAIYAAYGRNQPPSPAYTPAISGRMHSNPPDADFLIDGQDWQIGNLQVRQVSASGDSATVEASFTNFGRPTRVQFTMRRIRGRWLIANVRHLHKGSRFDLRRRLGMPALQ